MKALTLVDPGVSSRAFYFPDKVPEGIEYSVKKGKYYGYNVESIIDYGWGCAWRCIQMMLYHHLVDTNKTSLMLSFKDLFNQFGSKAVLVDIYKKMNNLETAPAFLEEKKFAPHDLSSGWAEPFIGQLVLSSFGKQCQLALINGYPVEANAHVDAFPKEPLTFDQFIQLLLKHFKGSNPGPVMIDDATFSICIIGIGINKGLINLWIADPHINTTGDASVGLCTVTLDKEGKLLKSSVTPDQEKFLYHKGASSRIYFNTKPWMVLL